MDASHPIFQGPFPVKPTLHDMETPEHYRRYPVGAALGPTMPAWRVHAEKAGPYVGVVADGYGFEDSPDSEWIASGRNSKNPRAVALGRQGNFFHWGFAATPAEMTDEARRVFLNTLAYMRGFDGVLPLAVGKGRSRQWLRVFATRVALDDSEYARKQLPPTWLEAAGDDPDRLAALCERELGFVFRRRDGAWAVDDDCRTLKLDNRRPESLSRCIELLAGGGPDAVIARRVLERYTDQRHATPEGWRKWLAACEDRLFFSDVLGQFTAAPKDYPEPHRATGG